MSICPRCENATTFDGSLPALILTDKGIYCRRCTVTVIDIKSVLASREIECPAIGNEICECAVCVT